MSSNKLMIEAQYIKIGHRFLPYIAYEYRKASLAFAGYMVCTYGEYPDAISYVRTVSHDIAKYFDNLNMNHSVMNMTLRHSVLTHKQKVVVVTI
jgi:hypothetical protein